MSQPVTLICASGEYTLERLPKTQKGDLRAWDAADELLIHTLFDQHLSPKPNKTDAKRTILIINDSFGALTVALHQHICHSWSDSWLTHLASQNNFTQNQLSPDFVAIPADQELNQSYDLVIIKIPKSSHLLEDQLCRLKPHINSESVIIAAAMSKHIHNSTLQLFEKIIGVTHTSRATKKARLIFAQNDQTTQTHSPYPKIIHDKELSLTLSNHANVFSQDKLDIGTRFLIQQLTTCLSTDSTVKHLIDLGCGNGALGIVAQGIQTDAKVHFVDESYQAVASAQTNYSQAFPQGEANFIHSDCLSQYTHDAPQLILCNPPFHQGHSIGDHIAWKMFQQSLQQLAIGGELWVVGNRHLAYHSKLKKLFGNCRQVASNKKFVVLASKKRDE